MAPYGQDVFSQQFFLNSPVHLKYDRPIYTQKCAQMIDPFEMNFKIDCYFAFSPL